MGMSSNADSLYDLLVPHLTHGVPKSAPPPLLDNVTDSYLNRLSTLSLPSLTDAEPQSLAQSAHSNLLNIQSLSARSNAALVASSDHLSVLRTVLPRLAQEADSLRVEIPKLDSAAVTFAEKYSKNAENHILDRRKEAILVASNSDRISDILDLPTLLHSAIASSTALGAPNTINYASALDLHSHIKRLHLLHHKSAIVGSIYAQAEEAMQGMASNLIISLRSQNIKLAAGMRTIGWLRRVAPELDGSGSDSEGSLGALFLVCRLATLMSMLSALDPLRELADQETSARLATRKTGKQKKDSWSGGQQTERFLKRYIEIFREQSFAIVSLYKSIFPSAPDTSLNIAEGLAAKLKSLGLKSPVNPRAEAQREDSQDPLAPMPSALATFSSHLVSLLMATLKEYLPNVRDKAARESLLTQILYCAGSLGRLGGDFSLMLTDLGHEDEISDDEESDEEWVSVMKKHRVLAGKLEKLASGGG